MAMTAIILVALSTFVYQISITIAAPANAVFSTPALSLTQLNESMPEIQNLTSSEFLSTNAASVCLLDGLLRAPPQRFAVRVAGTLTILDVVYCPESTIDRDAMEQTLDVAYTAMTNRLNTHGDGPLLPPSFDPYVTPRIAGVNCTMRAHSIDNPYYLTFQVMVNALRWLYEFLYDGNRAGSVVMSVMDEGVQPGLGKLGVASVMPYGD